MAGAPNLWLSPLTPQDGSPPVYSPFISEPPPKVTGPNPIAFLPVLSNYMCIFLTALVVQVLVASFQLVFSENWSTYRCIVDVFLGVTELHILLLHHLDPSSSNAFSVTLNNKFILTGAYYFLCIVSSII